MDVEEKVNAKVFDRLYPNGVEYGKAIIADPPTFDELGDIIEESDAEPAEPISKTRMFNQAIKPPV